MPLIRENRTLAAVVLGGILLTAPFVASGAIERVAPPAAQGPIATVEGDIIPLFKQILTWVAVAFWIAAIGFVLYAAFLYLTAAGNTEKAGKANKQLVFSLVAMIIGVIAYSVPFIVEDFLGGAGP